MGIIFFPKNGKDIINLEQNSGQTDYLESCVAVASRFSNYAPLSYLTQLSNLTEFFNWFSQVTPKDSNCYIVGGLTGKSEEFVENIVMNLLDLKYTKIKMDVLGLHHRIFSINKEKNQVHYFNQTMDASGNIVYHPMGSNIL